MDFHAPLKKLQLKTFAALGKVPKVLAGSGQAVLRSTRAFWSSPHDVSLTELLMFPLGSVLLFIATPEGLLVKTGKATLMKLLEKGIECLEVAPLLQF